MNKLERTVARLDILEFAASLDVCPDPVQSEILSSPHRRLILNCCRQWGKTTITALKAAHYALCHANHTVLIASPTERQSTYLLNKCAAFLRQLNIPIKTNNRHHSALHLPNGATILGLPNQADTIRGFTVNFLIIDEAARVPDELYTAVRPMLITTGGHLWMLSTPNGRRGFFYQEWANSANGFT
ncbi:MAG: terminase family protein, partial [Bryobacteraceae bacterium]|nr:terminase family protein [Bryobacteraceae bacterium]